MRWTDVGGIWRGAVPVWIENVGGTVLSHELQTRPMCRVELKRPPGRVHGSAPSMACGVIASATEGWTEIVMFRARSSGNSPMNREAAPQHRVVSHLRRGGPVDRRGAVAIRRPKLVASMLRPLAPDAETSATSTRVEQPV